MLCALLCIFFIIETSKTVTDYEIIPHIFSCKRAYHRDNYWSLSVPEIGLTQSCAV